MKLEDDVKDKNTPIGTFVETTLDKLVTFIKSGHIPMAPSFITHDAGFLLIHGKHGFYALCEHADGSVHLLYAKDISVFDPLIHANPAARTDTVQGFWLNPENWKQIELIASRDSHDGQKWALAEIAHHEKLETTELIDFGYLLHPSFMLYESGSIAYHVKDITLSDRKSRKLVKKNVLEEGDNDVSYVRCYTTEGKEQPFAEFGEGFLRKMFGRALTLTSIARHASQKDALKIIIDDFVARVDLSLRGFNPRQLGYMFGKKEYSSTLSPYAFETDKNSSFVFVKSIAMATGSFIKAHTKTVINDFTNQIHANFATGKKSQVFFPVLAATASAASQIILGRWLIGILRFASRFAGPLGKRIARTFKKPEIAGILHSTKDVSKDYGEKGHMGAVGAGYYNAMAYLHTKVCKFLMPTDTRVKPVIGNIEIGSLSAEFAAHKIFDTLGAPEGSLFEIRRINNMDVLRIQQPDGIEVYRLVGKGVAYARYIEDYDHPKSTPIHKKVKELFDSTDNVVRIALEGNQFIIDNIDEEGFITGLDAETKIPPSKSLIPEPMHDLGIIRKEWDRTATPEIGLIGKAVRASGISKIIGVSEERRKTAAAAFKVIADNQIKAPHRTNSKLRRAYLRTWPFRLSRKLTAAPMRKMQAMLENSIEHEKLRVQRENLIALIDDKIPYDAEELVASQKSVSSPLVEITINRLPIPPVAPGRIRPPT